jgi:hypothetical protein
VDLGFFGFIDDYWGSRFCFCGILNVADCFMLHGFTHCTGQHMPELADSVLLLW